MIKWKPDFSIWISNLIWEIVIYTLVIVFGKPARQLDIFYNKKIRCYECNAPERNIDEDSLVSILNGEKVINTAIICSYCGSNKLCLGIGRQKFGSWNWKDESNLPESWQKANAKMLGLTLELENKIKAETEIEKYLKEVAKR